MKDGWEIKKIEEVCEVLNGGTPDTKIPEFWGGQNAWITPKDMGKLKTIYVEKTERYLSDAGLKNSSAKMLPENSIILSSRAPIGYLAINKVKVSTNQGCKGLVPKNSILSHYLYYFLFNSFDLLNKLGSGTTFNELSSSKLAEVKVPLPPLSEQQRIVAILDQSFAAITKAKENAEKNLKNAREVFESYLQGVFEDGNWESRTIEVACDEIFAGGDAPKDNFSVEPNEKHQIPIYANAVKDKGLYGFTSFPRVTKSCVTIAARGSGTGHTELRNEPFLPIVRLIVCIPNVHQITTEFLKYSIDNLVIKRSGSAIPQLTVPMIKDYLIPLPSIEEQTQIIKKAEALIEQVEMLETIYQQKLVILEELKKSLLQRAFAGELNTEKEM